MKKEKRTFEYKCKMIVKLIIWLLPLILFFMSLINNSLLNAYADGHINQFARACSSFITLEINQWYGYLLSAIGFTNLTGVLNNYYNLIRCMFTYYPLYLLWVEVFDLVLHCFLILPKLGHKLLGESD